MLLRYCFFLFLMALAVVIAVLLGESGPWYFSWVLGTGFMILVSSMGAILLDEQEEAAPEA
ncbi:cytochrome bd oxidase small subunit, CydX/CbdX family [Ancylobacter sp. A5.8]|uniref:cytochrome bd oxidase small subunit, CydX/CbdX family n=1 Tax=Ancylobacter gelatini TaxID=2919920 RepID=UPI001F4E000D|nr:cytochrome bd oxidase small subunit, CydX/CbdX family [Ancylobacter gelatini]MCJ8144348.1 cytochrome bd oxidase small subunit, CydX/CbdX family [Ancylobacter gelatini]